VSSKKKAKKSVARYARTVQKNIRIAQRTCVNGCGRAKAGYRFCPDCGASLPGYAVEKNTVTPTADFLTKGAASTVAVPVNPSFALWDQHPDRYSDDPAIREAAWNSTVASYLPKGR
jgi:hypothetical protein